MPSICPTTVFVTGSISITLSPAALVWTMRTLAACRDAAAAASNPTRTERTKRLVFIAGYFKLRSHARDPLFAGGPVGSRVGHPAGVGAGRLRAELRRVQGEGRAAAAREAPRPRALRCLPLDGDGVPPAAAVARGEDLERRAVAEELRDGQA